MLDYNKVIDGSRAFEMVKLDAQNDRCSHAYLFVSPDENYLNCFAEKVAGLFINLHESENANNNVFRIAKRVHPDVKFYGEQKAVDVSVVSEIIESSGISPFEADKKIFVIARAGEMNESSQNKILKTIEEPASETYFILTATSTTKLLPTVLSRVKQIELDELSPAKISLMLQENGVDKNKSEIFASCANQNGTFAEKLATDDSFVDFFGSVVSCFFEINGSRDVLKFSSIFGAKTVDKEEFVDICLLVLRDLNVILAGKQELVMLKNVLPKLKVISAMLNTFATETLIKTCLEAKESLHYYVNSTAVVDSILFKIAEVKVKCRKL